MSGLSNTIKAEKGGANTMITQPSGLFPTWESMDDAISYYYAHTYATEEALDCTSNPDCPRHGKNTAADRARIAQHYAELMTDLCHSIVQTYERTNNQ